MSLFDLFLTGPQQSATFAWVLAFLALAAGVGRLLGRPTVDGAALGFLVVGGGADLALFLSRQFALPTALFGLLTGAVALAVAWILRREILAGAARPAPLERHFLAAAALIALVVWCGNILHPWPDAGFSSHQAWVPLYVQESFDRGAFYTIPDMAFGKGVLTSLFYPADLLGLVALARWIGLSGLGGPDIYPAFNAGSIAATILMFWVLLAALGRHAAALWGFVGLSLGYFALDPFFRTTLGGNWGDVLMYLGGAVVCFHLVRGGRPARALIAAAGVSCFLVFARHYGAVYSALVIAVCFLTAWSWAGDRRLRPWVVVGLLWLAFSARELYYLFGQITPYYPGSWQAERLPWTTRDLALGTLTDWGIIEASRPSLDAVSPRIVYLPVLAGALWLARDRLFRSRRRLAALAAPFLLLLGPLLVQGLTGYRTNAHYSKLYIPAIFFFAWYPCFVAAAADPARRLTAAARRHARPILAGAAIIAVVGAGLGYRHLAPAVAGTDSLGAAVERLVGDRNPDRAMARALRRTLSPAAFADAVARPILYVHYEPGLSLRQYIGGRFFRDLDFWSERTVALAKDARDVADLLARLGYPNIYVGLTTQTGIPVFDKQVPRRIVDGMATLADKPWAAKTVTAGRARFYVVKRP